MTPADHEALVKRLRNDKSSQDGLGNAVPHPLILEATTALESLAPVTEAQISAAYHRFVTGDEATQHERFRAALVALPNMTDGVREILQTIVDEMAGCRSGKCDDHAVRFGHDALVAAQSALTAAPPPTPQGISELSRERVQQIARELNETGRGLIDYEAAWLFYLELCKASPPTSQWQTMESAPRDGTHIWGWWAIPQNANGGEVYWDQRHETWRDFYHTPVRAIDLWQPLPDPPTEQDKP